MTRVPLFTLLSAAVALFFVAWQDGSAAPAAKDLAARVSDLESQLNHLRSLTSFRIAQQLEDALWNSRESRNLSLQGLMHPKQFQLEQLHQKQLEREAAFVNEPNNPELGIAELEVLAAERRVVQAEFQLESADRVRDRVLGPNKQLDFDKKWLEIAREKLTAAQTRLAALKK
jgi:hypothetical protein